MNTIEDLRAALRAHADEPLDQLAVTRTSASENRRPLSSLHKFGL